MILTGLIVILVMVLIMPFIFKRIEANLEAFLFVMGLMAAVISGKMSTELVLEALWEPIMITLAVLLAGCLFFYFNKQFILMMSGVLNKIPLAYVVFTMVLLLGLLSSVITAIVASIILVEFINVLPLDRTKRINLCILSCFAIGLGAVLTPIGEPLSTIAISKLNQSFFYLFNLLAGYIIPAVLALAFAAAVYTALACRREKADAIPTPAGEKTEIKSPGTMEQETWTGIILRALKVYLFVMALVFLGQGFEPLINTYLLGLSPQVLYWVNMISAILDNATLCAAEISVTMSDLTVRAILMGLLISGGMLIPGNIPNIICASKLGIGSKEWARLGIPLGLGVMVLFSLIIF